MKLNWKEAELWITNANKGKNEFEHVIWSWDCNFKLNYDGSLLKITSRFYPAAFRYGPTWDGTVVLYLGENVLISKDFDCKTLEELKKQVEDFVENINSSVLNILLENKWRLEQHVKPSFLRRIINRLTPNYQNKTRWHLKKKLHT